MNFREFLIKEESKRSVAKKLKEWQEAILGTQMAANRKTQYLDGWRAMGQRIPDEKDRKWYQGRLRMRQYVQANPDARTVDFRVLDDSQWDDPDYDVNVG